MQRQDQEQWQQVFLGCIGFGFYSARDTKDVLIVTDMFSKFACAFPTINQRENNIEKNLVKEIFLREYTVICVEILSELVDEICKFYRIRKSITTSYHPQKYRVCEQFNQKLHGMLFTYGKVQKDQCPRQLVDEFCKFYRIKRAITTSYHPQRYRVLLSSTKRCTACHLLQVRSENSSGIGTYPASHLFTTVLPMPRWCFLLITESLKQNHIYQWTGSLWV